MSGKRAFLKMGFAGMVVAASVASNSANAQVPIGPKKPQSPATAIGEGVSNPAKPAVNLAPVRPTKPLSGALAGVNVKDLKIVAVVNAEQITRAELGKECVRRYGQETLESMLNRVLIQQACQKANISIKEEDVDDEIARIAGRFSLPVDRWAVLLQEERGISMEQYRHEIIWPTVALRALAADKITVSQEELNKAFESEFGPRVRVRLITTNSEKIAKDVLAKAKANPESFSDLAKKFCADPNIASVGGAIPPIRKHLGDENLEKIAFNLEDGKISSIIKIQNQYVILKCEGHDPARPVPPQQMKQIEESLADRIRDTKLRTASQDFFAQLQKESQVVNVYNDPKLREAQPGVAATINNRPLTMAQLTEECISRHGSNVLEGEINRKLLTQELLKKNLVVKQEHLDAEVSEAAITYGCIKPDGSPDIEKWLKQVVEQDSATVELYIQDAVWPSVALKLLAADGVDVTAEDLKKGFESNYGPRVEVLAIVVGSQRHAQQIWDNARQTPTDDFFGKLAAEYSIEPVSRGNNGKVPPVRKHGGQPIVEEEAFKLKKGDLSSILAVGDKFVILRCLGRTQPVVQKMDEVRDELEKDIHQKKLSVAMSQTFDRIRDTSQIDNFMAGSSQSGRRTAPAQNSAFPTGGPSARVGALPATKSK